MTVLDADGHIHEPEAMYAEMEAELYPRRPVMVKLPDDTAAGGGNLLWLIEGKAVPTIAGRGSTQFTLPGSRNSLTKRATVGNQTLEDVDARLAGMDEIGIDMQAIFPTMFLINSIEDVTLEGALYRAYNNYLAGAASRSRGRLKWNAIIPWRDPEAAVVEVRRASDLGCSGIFTMGVIYEQQLNDPAFFPIYQAASDLDLPIAIHLGWGSTQATQIFAENAFFCSATIPVIWGFVFVMNSGLLGRFPRLRVGFIETGAQWVPYAINQVRRQYEPPVVKESGRRLGAGSRRGGDADYYRDPMEWFAQGRAFVTFEEDEDLPHLLKHLGEDALMMSTDYPHGDLSADHNFVAKLRRRDDVSDRVKAKLLGGNADRFYRE
jgi:predicted TIM-barrel fold metal-dependent hydrolase